MVAEVTAPSARITAPPEPALLTDSDMRERMAATLEQTAEANLAVARWLRANMKIAA